MKRVLVVGGAGYVGSVLTRELLNWGYKVRVLDTLYFGDQGLRDLLPQIELVIDDMRTVKPSLLEGIDGVVNLGGLSNDPMAHYNPQANYEMNVLATHQLAEMCKNQGIQRYILASTCSIYDREEKSDLVEEDKPLDERAEVNPISAYSRSKYEAECRLLDMVDRDFCAIILRKGTIYGFSPRMRYDLVVNTMIKDALSTGYITVFNHGDMWRPLVDVRDVAAAYILSLEAPLEKIRGEIFNVSYGNYRIIEIASMIKTILDRSGINVAIKDVQVEDRVRSYQVSTEKIQRMLDFNPLFSVEKSINDLLRELANWQIDHFSNPIYYNIQRMNIIDSIQNVFNGSEVK